MSENARSSSSYVGVDRHSATAPIDSVSSLPSVPGGNDRNATGHRPVSQPVQAMAAGSDGVQDLGATPTFATQPAANDGPSPQTVFARIQKTIITFGKFIGPGFMIAVAYSGYLHDGSSSL